MSRRGRRAALAATGGLAVFAGAGVVSNRVSAAACERHVARWVATTALGGRPFVVKPQGRVGGGGGSLARFAAAGVVPPQAQAGVGGPALPWGEVGPARSVVPFIVEVEYGWSLAPQYGEGGSRRFLCLFGHVIEIGERPHWSA